jgi:hypothetical protein
MDKYLYFLISIPLFLIVFYFNYYPYYSGEIGTETICNISINTIVSDPINCFNVDDISGLQSCNDAIIGKCYNNISRLSNTYLVNKDGTFSRITEQIMQVCRKVKLNSTIRYDFIINNTTYFTIEQGQLITQSRQVRCYYNEKTSQLKIDPIDSLPGIILISVVTSIFLVSCWPAWNWIGKNVHW